MKSSRVELRMEPEEKDAFEAAAKIAGLPLSTWMRTSLRRAVIREFEEASRPVPFLPTGKL